MVDDVAGEWLAEVDRMASLEQRKREVQCAVNLAEKLKLFASDGEAPFTAALTEEAEELAQTAFGRTLLSKISYVYNSQALQAGADGKLAEMGASLRATGHTWGSRMSVVKTAVKTIQGVRAMTKAAEEAERVGKIKMRLEIFFEEHARDQVIR